MSLIHWDKSVLSFHLKEIIEDHQGGDQKALLGLGVILMGTVALPLATKFGRPILKGIIKTGLSLYQESKPPKNALTLSQLRATKNTTVPSLLSDNSAIAPGNRLLKEVRD